MKVKAVRLYGKNDLRLDEFNLRDINDDEILAEVITDSICMSTYKAAVQGSDHKRVPEDIDINPIVIGHEFAGIIREVGKNLQKNYKKGDKFTIQPNINHLGKGYAPGYSFTDFGGNATHIVIPAEVMKKGFLLEYTGDAFFKASLAEPISCLIAAFNASYHLAADNKTHVMGIKESGNLAILAGCGPMGLGAIDLALNMKKRPKTLVVTDIDQTRIDRANKIFSEEKAAARGVHLVFINTSGLIDSSAKLRDLTQNEGFDDIFVLAPVADVVELADAIAGKDACLNFFSGPTNTSFSAKVNFYDIHYKGTHIMGTSGGDTDDMREALRLAAEKSIEPAVMVTHIGGLNAAAETTLNLPKIPGGKKLIYTNLDFELTAIDDFELKGRKDPLFRGLALICENHDMLWSAEAEEYLLKNANKIL